jgi:CRP-like cAMP-binding protein
MTESLDETKSNFVEGISVSPGEMQAQYGIPPEEFASFRDITRIYPGGETLIKEGDQERALYLLRAGSVEVFKGFGAARESMGTIDAVNFFGEMSMINDEPRSATVQALSERVVVYRIPNPNIHTILTNPLWAELLISRLARNLAEHVEQHLVASEQVKELRAEVARLTAALAGRRA